LVGKVGEPRWGKKSKGKNKLLRKRMRSWGKNDEEGVDWDMKAWNENKRAKKAERGRV